MCTIADAKVPLGSAAWLVQELNYNCYNVYFNECLLSTFETTSQCPVGAIYLSTGASPCVYPIRIIISPALDLWSLATAGTQEGAVYPIIGARPCESRYKNKAPVLTHQGILKRS